MKSFLRKCYLIFNTVRFSPLFLISYFCKNKEIIIKDVERWGELHFRGHNFPYTFICVVVYFPEFRSLLYNRLGIWGRVLNVILPGRPTLYIDSREIGEGLIIQHGFATIISAKSIGKNCWINQQVTIGYSNKTDHPTILDNVTINSGAKVLGNVTIGNNSIVGANAVVVKDVPDNCTVVGVPAYIVKRDGIKVRESL